MRRASRGQVGAEFAMVVAFLFALGVMGVQFFGLGLTAAKVSHAAQEAAYVAGGSLEAATGPQTPCWSISGGLAHPEGYADTAVCHSVLENLGETNPDLVSVSVSPTLVNRSTHAQIHVTVTYRQPISSPLLRLFMGDTFTTSADGWSQ
ncbi:MAG: hypothetical protein E6I99_00675 [Chloroflexi bacterium]|nr:MAG: hypothetical protein E6I99_00675 [Chloroflexota bacterium]TMD84302.1 MAG: hypothetical protein E6I74_03310 [Chloroflexota bacterium]